MEEKIRIELRDMIEFSGDAIINYDYGVKQLLALFASEKQKLLGELWEKIEENKWREIPIDDDEKNIANFYIASEMATLKQLFINAGMEDKL